MANYNRKSGDWRRWITIPFVVVVGVILWEGVLSMPGADSILYAAVVIGIAALLAYADRKGGGR
jgi:hypothetical protein